MTHAYATKLLFVGTRTVGIEFLRFGALEQAHAASEVIVSAGALRSPQLLMLSGIGPKAELERRGIQLRLDLPGVGGNLQDHLHTRVRCEITQPLTFAPLPDDMKTTALHQYDADRSGAPGSNFLEAGAFVKAGIVAPHAISK